MGGLRGVEGIGVQRLVWWVGRRKGRKIFKRCKLLIFMDTDVRVLHEDMQKIQRELVLIKKLLLMEGNLSDWAKTELQKAREEEESVYTDLEDL